MGLTVLSEPGGEITAPVGSGPASAGQAGHEGSAVLEVAAPEADDPISDAELQYL